MTCQVSRSVKRIVDAERGKQRRVVVGKQGATKVTFKNHELETSTSLRTFVRVALISSSCVYQLAIIASVNQAHDTHRCLSLSKHRVWCRYLQRYIAPFLLHISVLRSMINSRPDFDSISPYPIADTAIIRLLKSFLTYWTWKIS